MAKHEMVFVSTQWQALQLRKDHWSCSKPGCSFKAAVTRPGRGKLQPSYEWNEESFESVGVIDLEIRGCRPEDFVEMSGLHGLHVERPFKPGGPSSR